MSSCCDSATTVDAIGVAKIESIVRQVLADQGRDCGSITPDTPLMAKGIGLDSLDFAVLVVKLEEHIGFDPFLRGDVQRFPTTVAELAALYAADGTVKQ